MAEEFTEQVVEVGGSKVHMLTGGSGDPLVIFHGAGGNAGWLRYAQALADHYTVYIPSHPGYHQSERPEWLESITDMASFYSWFMEEQELEGARAIGFSMGGWIAAEIAASTSRPFSKLMLVGSVGIQPKEGEITDIFIISPAQVNELLFHDPSQAPEYDQLYGETPTREQADIAEDNREMAVRLCWKPYMYNPRLSGVLARVKFPTRIVWGREDRLVPVECAELFHQAIPGSDVVIIDGCGHSPQVEKPDEFVKVALEFLA